MDGRRPIEPMFKDEGPMADPHLPGPGGNSKHPILEMIAAARQGGAPPGAPAGPGGPPEMAPPGAEMPPEMGGAPPPPGMDPGMDPAAAGMAPPGMDPAAAGGPPGMEGGMPPEAGGAPPGMGAPAPPSGPPHAAQEAIRAALMQVLAERGITPGEDPGMSAPDEMGEGGPDAGVPDPGAMPPPEGGEPMPGEEQMPMEEETPQVEKSAVNYRPYDRPSQSCQACGNFVPVEKSVIPSGDGGGSCHVVSGPILPQATCDKFEPSQQTMEVGKAIKILAQIEVAKALLKAGKKIESPVLTELEVQEGEDEEPAGDPKDQKPGKKVKVLPKTLKSVSMGSYPTLQKSV